MDPIRPKITQNVPNPFQYIICYKNIYILVSSLKGRYWVGKFGANFAIGSISDTAYFTNTPYDTSLWTWNCNMPLYRSRAVWMNPAYPVVHLVAIVACILPCEDISLWHSVLLQTMGNSKKQRLVVNCAAEATHVPTGASSFLLLDSSKSVEADFQERYGGLAKKNVWWSSIVQHYPCGY